MNSHMFIVPHSGLTPTMTDRSVDPIVCRYIHTAAPRGVSTVGTMKMNEFRGVTRAKVTRRARTDADTS